MANGELKSQRTRHGKTTWSWDAKEPMASYLTTATIGEFDLRAYRRDGIRYWDAIDPDLFVAAAARAPATQYAISQAADTQLQAAGAHDQRARRRRAALVLGQPRHRAGLGLHVRRGAHGRAADDWTTLPDLNGHTSDDTGQLVPVRRLAGDPPVPRPLPDRQRRRHLRPDRHDRRVERGDRRQRRLRAVDGRPVRLRGQRRRGLDQLRQRRGRPGARRVRRRRRACPAAPGATSFEDDGDTLDGWTVPGAAGGQPRQRRTTGSSARSPTRRRRAARSPRGSLDRAAGDHRVPVGLFGRYPFSAAGGIVDDVEGLGFALENQTRPIYAPDFFDDQRGRRPRRRPRARAPVDRRQPGRRRLAAHLAQRGLRDLHRVAVERARGARDRAGDLRQLRRRSRPTTRSGRSTIGDPGRTDLFDIPVYWRGGDDAARAAAADRRRRLLPAAASAGCGATPAATSRPPSSSRSPSGSPARTSATSSRRGCSRRRSPPGSSPQGAALGVRDTRAGPRRRRR